MRPAPSALPRVKYVAVVGRASRGPIRAGRSTGAGSLLILVGSLSQPSSLFRRVGRLPSGVPLRLLRLFQHPLLPLGRGAHHNPPAVPAMLGPTRYRTRPKRPPPPIKSQQTRLCSGSSPHPPIRGVCPRTFRGRFTDGKDIGAFLIGTFVKVERIRKVCRTTAACPQYVFYQPLSLAGELQNPRSHAARLRSHAPRGNAQLRTLCVRGKRKKRSRYGLRHACTRTQMP